jgi:hypothetical protein
VFQINLEFYFVVIETVDCIIRQDERYAADEEQYDWYQDFRGLEKYIAPYLKQVADFEILVGGCGNSSK